MEKHDHFFVKIKAIAVRIANKQIAHIWQQNSLLEKEKNKLSELQEKLEESQRQLNNCPESIRDIWEEELKKVSEWQYYVKTIPIPSFSHLHLIKQHRVPKACKLSSNIY